MKALSLHCDYALAVASGIKTVELRTWETSYRGDLLICSTKLGSKSSDLKDYYIFGKAIAIAEVVDCVPFSEKHRYGALLEKNEKVSKNTYSFILKNIRIIEPFDIKGQQRLFNVENDKINILPHKNINSRISYWIKNNYIKEYPWA